MKQEKRSEDSSCEASQVTDRIVYSFWWNVGAISCTEDDLLEALEGAGRFLGTH